MKEINVNFKIQENEKGRCFLVASSNRSKKILKRELDGETYDALINTRSEKTFLEIATALFNAPLKPEEELIIKCFPSKDHDDAHMWAYTDNGSGNIGDISMIFVSKESYNKFCQNTTINKLEIAYKEFQELIDSRIIQ